jgi:hypothetical protein
MFGSTVLEVVVGLVFCFACVSLVASALYEAFASMFKLRASSLFKGVKALLNDEAFTGLARDLYDHALVNPRSSGTSKAGTSPNVKPSYIKSEDFAQALLDCTVKTNGALEEFDKAFDSIEGNEQLKTLLKGLYARSGNDLEKLRKDLGTWFDAGMDRVSGAYKRQAQLWTFLVALVFAAVFNIDCINLAHELWRHPALTAQLPSLSGQEATAALDALNILPIGWPRGDGPLYWSIAGWLITAMSALFGAPFWFDALQRLVNVRGTGQKPAGK